MGSRKEEIVSKGEFIIRRMTGPARVLPDYVIIGAQRAGTTSLYNYLTEHPCVAPSFVKEVHFFDENHHRGLSWYRAHFPTKAERERVEDTQGVFMTGEATPYYLFHPLCPGRLASDLGSAKVMVLLRDPVARAYSHYQHEVRRGREDLTFEEALEREEKRLEGEEERICGDGRYNSHEHKRFSYKARGIYVDQVRRWMDAVGRERIMVIKSEDMYDKPRVVYGQVLEFLGLPAHHLPKAERFNYGRYSEMDEGTRTMLRDFFRPHNERLYELLEKDMGWD